MNPLAHVTAVSGRTRTERSCALSYRRPAVWLAPVALFIFLTCFFGISAIQSQASSPPPGTASYNHDAPAAIDPRLLTQLNWETRALYSRLRKSLVRVELDKNPVHILPPEMQRRFLAWERTWVLSHHFHANGSPDQQSATVAIVPEINSRQIQRQLNSRQQNRLNNLTRSPVAQLFLLRHFLFEMHKPDRRPPWQYLRLINQRLMLLHEGQGNSLPGVVVGAKHNILVLGLLGMAETTGKITVINYRGQRLTGQILGVSPRLNLSVVALRQAAKWPAIPLAHANRDDKRMQLSLNPNTLTLKWKIALRDVRPDHRRHGPLGGPFQSKLLLSRQGQLTGVGSGMNIFHVTRRNPVFREFIDTGVIRPRQFGIKYMLLAANSPARKANPILGNKPAILVLKVFPHSPAMEAGIRRGDLITALNNISILRLPTIMRRIHLDPSNVSVSAIRHNQPLTLSIDLSHMPMHPHDHHRPDSHFHRQKR